MHVDTTSPPKSLIGLCGMCSRIHPRFCMETQSDGDGEWLERLSAVLRELAAKPSLSKSQRRLMTKNALDCCAMNCGGGCVKHLREALLAFLTTRFLKAT